MSLRNAGSFCHSGGLNLRAESHSYWRVNLRCGTEEGTGGRTTETQPVLLISAIGVSSCSAIRDVGVLYWQQTDLYVVAGQYGSMDERNSKKNCWGGPWILVSFLVFHFLELSEPLGLSVPLSVSSLCCFVFLRANASAARPRRFRYPVQATFPAVGEFGIQPDTLPYILGIPVLPLHHGRRRRRPQHHSAWVLGSGAQCLTLHTSWSAAVSQCSRTSVAGEPRGEEGEQRGHFSDWGGQ